MKSFNILERSEKVHRHAMLEASAGTGKTFAIENVVVRLLIDPGIAEVPPSLEKILVVTFTRAAARDLKIRIRANLERCLDALNRYVSRKDLPEDLPDYLSAHIEKGVEAITLARRRIERALFSFDQAQLFTIHGFCWRMLRSYAIEAGIGLGAAYEEGGPQVKLKLLQAVRDFLRTELIPDVYSHQQIKIVLKRFGGQVENLQSELLKAVLKGPDIIAPPAYSEYAIKFFRAMSIFKSDSVVVPDRLVADFLLQASSYKGLIGKDKQVKPDIIHKVRRFARLFEKESWNTDDFDILIEDGLFIVEALQPGQLLARCKPASPERLNYPGLQGKIAAAIGDIVNSARDVNLIFARMAADCQRLIRNYQQQEELLGFNELVEKMRQSSSDPVFADKVRTSFDAVIVDEFQDTDPAQWDVFRLLFADAGQAWKGFLYLVGDPKQSIYAFRQADIYTYLTAGKAIGEEEAATLDTNYRSQPALVDALNTIFESAAALFPLPRIQSDLPYRHVKAGRQECRTFSDARPCLQFWLAEESGKKRTSLQDYEKNYFFPAMAREILRLHREDGVGFRECAVLVADRFQAERLMLYFRERGIPFISQKGINLAESEAVESMRELVKGIFNFRHASSLRTALGGRMIGMDHKRILALTDEVLLHAILEKCDILRKALVDKGFACFYALFLKSGWHDDGESIIERLAAQAGGAEFFSELQDVAELLIMEQNKNTLSVDGLLEFLDSFGKLASHDDERMKAFTNQEQDGVPILTSHVSKGLEFEIVFALGLIKRSEVKDMLAPVLYGQTACLAGMPGKESNAYKDYCHEIDAEKMRRLYVAFTRAKHRLYVPVAMKCGGGQTDIGEASPTELFIARLGSAVHDAADCNVLYAKINAGGYASLSAIAADHPSLIMLTTLEKDVCEENYLDAAEPPCLRPPSQFEVPGAVRFVQSFTSLAQISKLSSGEELMLGVPHDFQCELKSSHTLPAGSDTGVLLHTIFEKIPFSAFKNVLSSETLLPFTQDFLNGTVLEGWHGVAADITYRAFTTPLPGAEPPFCLADIDPQRIYREMEFFFPHEGDPELLDITVRPGYIKGVIDLLFEHQGKYYILDWKSNWLGPAQEYYRSEILERAMMQHDYFLQARLYASALKRYLQIFDSRPFDEIFGGAYYYFLRGIGPATGILALR